MARDTIEARTGVPVADLRRFGVDSIDGLAFDVASGSLLIVDAARSELAEIDMNEL